VTEIFSYRGKQYPGYLREGNAMQHIVQTASHFCQGNGLDVGAGKWPFPGSTPIELTNGQTAENLPEGQFDFIFSSHCMEHLVNPVAAIEHWKTRLKAGGTLFLYLPHPDMTYWNPQNCKKHLHLFYPKDIAQMLQDLGFIDVIHSERDLAWSFSVVGFNG
jgi:SAM-dependent methyltransferase